MKTNFLQNTSIRQTFLNRNFIFFGFLYLLFITIFEKDPANAILLIVVEGIAITIVGFFFGLYKMSGVKNFFARFFVALILVPINLFFISIPLTIIILFNRPFMPELDLYYSEAVEQIGILMEAESTWSNILAIFTESNDQYKYFALVAGIFFLYKVIYGKKKDEMDEGAFAPVAYTGLLTIISLAAFFGAFMLQYLIPQSFPYTFLFITRLMMARFSKSYA